MKKLRIALIAPQPFVDIRGTCMANLRIIQVLAGAGHEIDVITYPFGSAPEFPCVNVYRCRPIPFVHSVRIGFSFAKVFLDLKLALLALKLIRAKRYDCVHGVEEGAFIGGILARLAGIPAVYDMDSVLSHEIAGSPIGKFPPVVWFVRAVENWAIRKAALVVTISDSMAAYVRQIDPLKDIAVVPDTPVPMPAATDRDATRATAQMPYEFHGRKLILYTGSLAGYQGLDLLISAMASVTANTPEAVLVIIGGDEQGIRRLSKLAKTDGVMGNLLFMGKKPLDQIPDFLSAADVLVSPRRGGINPPAKIYTYMQSGKPIVATDVPAHTTVIGRDAAVLVKATSEGIAEGILWVFAHPGEADQKAVRAKEIVGEITPGLQARRILDAYEILAVKTFKNSR